MSELSFLHTVTPIEARSLIVSILSHVPDVVWAALIAAGIAFLTTRLSNRNSRQQLQMQLDHDARQKNREREMALRRDVYLPALEAVTRCSAALGQLANLDADLAAVGRQLVADLATIAKVQLIASEPTIEAIMAFLRAFLPAYIEIMSLRAPLLIRQQVIAVEQSVIDRSFAELQRLTQLMRQHNLSGSTDRGPMDRLNAQVVIEQTAIQTHSEKRDALSNEQQLDKLRLLSRLTTLNASVAQCMPDALIAARRELELPLDAAHYRRLFAQQQEAVDKVMNDLVERGQQPSADSSASTSEPQG
jgi:hypothetical protein